jgi:methionyl-tRNA formyltransferase
MPGLKIVFMGTPEFAVPSLELLINNGHNVVGVLTSPDKPQGRGQKIVFSPIKSCALNLGLKVFQPVNLKDSSFLEELKSLSPDLQVVVAFRMLPETVWRMPGLGTFNLHASLLPEYRGAAPINWAIINGESKTGLTTFLIDREIDTGKILFQQEILINPDEDAGGLHDRLMNQGASLVLKTVEAISRREINPVIQSFTGELKKAPKLNKDMCRIDFSKPALALYNFVRGLSPYPGAWTMINSRQVKIYKTGIEKENINIKAGSPITDEKTYLKFQTASGILDIVEFQVEGKKRMTAREFFRGNKL